MATKYKAKLTHKTDTTPVTILIDRQKNRREENLEYLKDLNVKAFLGVIAWAEGGGYDFKYGAVANKRNDPWRFSDTSTHPGAGYGGKITAAGLYQITRETWKERAVDAMGITDFTPATQDLITVDLLRTTGAADDIKNSDFDSCLKKAARRWNALPLGKGLTNRITSQPYKPYEDVLEMYQSLGGSIK